MAKTTPIYGLPYPELPDRPHVPDDMQGLAEATETAINSVAQTASGSGHNHDDRYLKLIGGTLNGDVVFNAGVTVQAPTEANNPVTRAYVDALPFPTVTWGVEDPPTTGNENPGDIHCQWDDVVIEL